MSNLLTPVESFREASGLGRYTSFASRGLSFTNLQFFKKDSNKNPCGLSIFIRLLLKSLPKTKQIVNRLDKVFVNTESIRSTKM